MIEAGLSRRDMIKLSFLGAAALALPLERTVRAKVVSQIAASKLPAPYTLPFAVPPAIDARTVGSVVEIEQKARQVSILPGYSTTIFGYSGYNRLLGGAPSPAIAPGPTIHTRRGVPITVRQHNRLPATHPQWRYTSTTSTHLHGSASRPQYDGYASDVTAPGQIKTYLYPNKQDARTLWYHDHGVGHTAENAYMGLAAQYHLHDEVESGLVIPKWKFDGRADADQFDLPVTITDKMFSSDGNFRYDDSGHSGLWGDVVLVNGVPWPLLRVKPRTYRLRVLNASLSRGYTLSLSNGASMTVIGTDGGLMPAPQQTTRLRIGMAERYEVIIDFSRFAAGATIDMRNLGVKNSTDFDNTGKVMRFQVLGRTDPGYTDFDRSDWNPAVPVPPVLNPNQDVMGLTEAQSVGTTKIEVVRQGGEWKIASTDPKGVRKNMTWEDVIASEYKEVVANPQLGEVQVWEIKNSSGGWFHPVHIHLVDFRILSRNGKAPFVYEKGPKDVAYVGENETVRAIMRFGTAGDTSVTGRYMIHCHNLPHEDHDMMTQFRVGGDIDDVTSPDCNDPLHGDPAKPDDDD